MTKPKGFSDEAKKWMAERSAAFQKATQRKGMPMTYGAQKKDKRT